jgi:putative glycerol-1-phosphate prenyltransferase
MHSAVYPYLLEKKKTGQKSFAILIDPDKTTPTSLRTVIDLGNAAKADYFFVGGSLVVTDHLDDCILQIKKESNIPVILFP